jgi:hypothetical protein
MDTIVADPHRKTADADPGKNLNVDADSCPYLLNYGEPSNGIRNFLRDYPASFQFLFLTYMDRPRPDFQKF